MKTLPIDLTDCPGVSSAVKTSYLPVAVSEAHEQYTSPVITFDAASDCVVFWDGERGLWWSRAAIFSILVFSSEDHVYFGIDEIKGLAAYKLLVSPISNNQGVNFLRATAVACSKLLNTQFKDLTKNAQQAASSNQPLCFDDFP